MIKRRCAADRRIVKAHGLKGELTMEVINGVFDDVETEYLLYVK